VSQILWETAVQPLGEETRMSVENQGASRVVRLGQWGLDLRLEQRMVPEVSGEGIRFALGTEVGGVTFLSVGHVAAAQ
jgi:hypothetical protein